MRGALLHGLGRLLCAQRNQLVPLASRLYVSTAPCRPRTPQISRHRYGFSAVCGIAPLVGTRVLGTKGTRNMAAAAVGRLQVELVEVDNTTEALNFILGQSHFIKTVEDLAEALFQSGPSIKFGLAFCEASGDRKIRFDGNDETLIELAKKNALAIGAGHSFIIFLKDAFPINVLKAVSNCPTVCRVFCATANPTAVVVGRDNRERRGILGVLDGYCPLGVENEADQQARRELLRKIGYKR